MSHFHPPRSQYKLCKVRKLMVGTRGVPHLVTHDARTIRYPDPLIKVNDTVRIDLDSGKITEFIKFDTGEGNRPAFAVSLTGALGKARGLFHRVLNGGSTGPRRLCCGSPVQT